MHINSPFCFFPKQRLNSLAALVRGELPKLVRNVLGALITIDVHARDIISTMVQVGIDSADSFEWLKQMRYYWDQELDNCVVRMSTSQYVYGYEYLGASARLVITPLTVSSMLKLRPRKKKTLFYGCDRLNFFPNQEFFFFNFLKSCKINSFWPNSTKIRLKIFGN